MKKYLFLFTTFLYCSLVFSQTLDKIGKKDMVTVGGGLNYSSNYYAVSGKTLNRDPFAWTLGGNLNISILDVSLPFTFSFTNQGGSYTQPFNIIALHPSYKKFKSHIGTFSMSFSPYTYSGLNVAGGGLEYKPGNWNFQIVGGRFRKAVEYNPELNNSSTMSYARWGGGFMLGYEKSGIGFQWNVLQVNDDPSSLMFVPTSSTITPMSNLCSSIKVKATVLKSLTAETEVATSIITRNNENENPTTASSPVYSWVRGNQTTDQHMAVNGSLNYRIKQFSIGAKYERVNPGYTTLGGMYFNNDLENITVTPTASLFKGKININSNVGIQRNNLANTTANATKRWVGTIAVSANVIKNLSLSANYSNFSTYSKRNPVAFPLLTPIADTLNFYQISSNFSASASLQVGKKIKNMISANVSSSISENITGRLENAAAFGFNVDGNTGIGPVKANTAMLSHTFSKEKSPLNLGYTLNYTESIAASIENAFFGPGVTFGYPIQKKKINFSAGAIYNQNYTNSKLSNHVFSGRCGFGYSPEWWDKKYGKCSISINASLIEKLPILKTEKAQVDFTLLGLISYSF